MAKLKLLSVDAFGTSVQLQDPIPRIQQWLLKQLPQHPAAIQLVEKAFLQEVNYYQNNMHLGYDHDSTQSLRNRCAEQLFLALGQPYQALTPLQQRACLDQALVFKVKPELINLLQWSRSKGLIVALCSNWDYSLLQLTEQLQIRHYFDHVLISAQLGVAKPDTDFFHHLLSLVKLEANEALHIGDDFNNDYQAACKAGLHGLWFNPSNPAMNCLSRVPQYLQTRFALPH